jgi:Fe-S cluster assembly ATP-binding protein
MLQLHNYSVAVDDKHILKDITLAIQPGEIHAIMGPNGSGKTSLALSMIGHPGYKIASHVPHFKFHIDGENVAQLSSDERAKRGLFVSFQSPIEIPGVSLLAFLRTAAKALRPDEKKPLSEFKKELQAALTVVGLDSAFMQRSINEGFSGGERKRAEIAQMFVLKPKFAVLDEIDSGLDIDSLKRVATAVRVEAKKQKIGLLVITHYSRILRYLRPDTVHILKNGELRHTGKMSLVRKIEAEGYATI